MSQDDYPVHRARRVVRPEEVEEMTLADDGDFPGPGYELAFAGDQILGKISLQHETAVGDGWFTFGLQTTVQPGEDESEAAARVRDFISSQVYASIDEVTNAIEEAVAVERQRLRQRRNPRASAY